MYRTSFDPITKKGNVIVNISKIKKNNFNDVMNIFLMAFNSDLLVSPYIKILYPGDQVENIKIESEEIG